MSKNERGREKEKKTVYYKLASPFSLLSSLTKSANAPHKHRLMLYTIFAQWL